MISARDISRIRERLVARFRPRLIILFGSQARRTADARGWTAELKAARKLTYYAISARYPGEADEVSLKEASEAVRLAGQGSCSGRPEKGGLE